jgi:hypothetical protein
MNETTFRILCGIGAVVVLFIIIYRRRRDSAK